jgi:hypothetical protein
VPITLGFLIGSPKYFIWWHVACQAVNAGINFGNRNAETPLTNSQVAFGFVSSVVSATLVVTMLKGRIARLVGRQGMISNLVVNTTACCIAAFVNTNCIRYGEGLNGTKVYEDPEMTKLVGVSKNAAWTAIEFTAIVRIVNSCASLIFPAVLCLLTKRFTVGPYRKYRTVADAMCIAMCLGITTPLCLSIFPSKIALNGSYLEQEFQGNKVVHFNKGT